MPREIAPRLLCHTMAVALISLALAVNATRLLPQGFLSPYLATDSAAVAAGKQESDSADQLFTETRIELSAEVESELHCLALNIYFEARSESEQGQRAVGHVVMNRVGNRHYPDTVCQVVRQGGAKQRNRCQFSWWCDGRPDEPLNQRAWRDALQLAKAVYFGNSEDPTDGALWYHASYVSPYWTKGLTAVKQIGQHVFYRKTAQPQYAMNQASERPVPSG